MYVNEFNFPCMLRQMDLNFILFVSLILAQLSIIVELYLNKLNNVHMMYPDLVD